MSFVPLTSRSHLAIAALTIVTIASTVAAPKPNVLILVADDMGYADAGFNGGRVIDTPNLDRLAATGVRLGNFHTAPICSPTRAGLMTGRWPLRFGIMRAVVPPWSKHGLPSEEKTLAETLAEAGYKRRGLVGKWHLGHARREFLPLQQGFTSFKGHYNGAVDYFSHEREGEVDWHEQDETIREEGYTTDLVSEAAAEFIRESPAPWFLYVPFNAPHSPFQAKEEDLAKYSHIKDPKRRAYAAMVDSMDQAIGRILDAVESRPDAANTLILFFSDNGGIPAVGSSSGPYRGGKFAVYEGGTRVCAAIRWPAGGLKGGREFDGRIGYIDVLPTVLAAAGLPVPSDVDGIDVMPALQGRAKLPERPWFSYIQQGGEADAAVHLGKWKLVAHGDVFSRKAAPRVELYDLDADIGEKQDIADRHPEIVRDLVARLREFGKLEKPGVGDYGEGREGFRAPKDWVVK